MHVKVRFFFFEEYLTICQFRRRSTSTQTLGSIKVSLEHKKQFLFAHSDWHKYALGCCRTLNAVEQLC